jgi:CHAT domain-containing protein
MARKWYLPFRLLQSILSKRYLIYCCGLVMLVFCVTIQPSLLIGERVNALSSAPSISVSSDTLLDQSEQLYQSKDYPNAIKSLKQAIDTYRSQGAILKQAISLSNLALVYRELGEWKEANQAISDSLILLKNWPNPGSSSILAQTLDIQGQLQFAQGQTESALASWVQTEQMYTRMGDDEGIARLRINQSQALRVLGFYGRAKTILEDVQKTLAGKPDSAIKVVTIRLLGTALEQLGELDEAIKTLKQGLEIAEKLKLDREISITQLVLGNVLQTQEKLASEVVGRCCPSYFATIDYYSKAATSPISFVSIQANLKLLSLQIETGQTNQVEKIITPIQRQLLKFPPSRTKFNIQINLAQNLAKLKRNEAGVKVLIEVFQKSQELNDRRIQSLALGTIGELYKEKEQWADAEDATKRALSVIENGDDLAYRWYAQLGSISAQQGNDKQAIYSYNAAIDKLELLRKDLANVNRDAQFNFKDSVEPTYRELVGLLLKKSNQNGNGQEQLKQARNLIDQLQVAELDNFFREACIDNVRVILDEAIVQYPRTAIVYPIILKDELDVIVSIPGQPLMHKQFAVKKESVYSTINQLRKYVVQPNENNRIKEESCKIYNWLISPFEKELGGKIDTLVFVLDGEFRKIPMNILYDGKNYLIEKKYNISTSLSLLVQAPKPISKATLNILFAGLPNPPIQYESENLPNVESQLVAIRRNGIQVKELKGENFTSQTFEKEIKSSPYNVIHLATHGEFSKEKDKTFLLAYDGKLELSKFDRIFRERATIQKIPLELLVLSACQTAKGDDRAILGLAGVSVKAGAQSVLASLWKVTDDSTAILMGEFYRELKTNQISKAEALRRAQIKLMADHAPSDWAAFILVGNWL